MWGKDDASATVPAQPVRVSQTDPAVQVLRQGVCVRHNPGQWTHKKCSLLLKQMLTFFLNTERCCCYFLRLLSPVGVIVFVMSCEFLSFPVAAGCWCELLFCCLVFYVEVHIWNELRSQRHSPLPILWAQDVKTQSGFSHII